MFAFQFHGAPYFFFAAGFLTAGLPGAGDFVEGLDGEGVFVAGFFTAGVLAGFSARSRLSWAVLPAPAFAAPGVDVPLLARDDLAAGLAAVDFSAAFLAGAADLDAVLAAGLAGAFTAPVLAAALLAGGFVAAFFS
ncbi:MAG: hypothetical protein WHV44_10005, partial [Anaerolineales bacterium]